MVKKISIIGSGSVGSNLAFHIISHLPLVKDLVLIDTAGDLARGVALDLEDTRGFLGFNTKITGSKNYSHIKDSDIVVITAGAARKQGMTRLDLFKINCKIVKQVSANIKKLAPTAIVVVVTNPMDLINYMVHKFTQFDRRRILGMGSVLDSSRLVNIIHQKTKVCPDSIEGYTFGLHSKDMIVSSDKIKIKGEPITKFCSLADLAKIQQKVKMRGAEIVGFLKKGSAHFAPSLACFNLVQAVCHDRGEIFPVSAVLKGEFGFKGFSAGVPCVIGREGIREIVEFELDEAQKQSFLEIKKMFQDTLR
jgi:malate dehydrogenase